MCFCVFFLKLDVDSTKKIRRSSYFFSIAGGGRFLLSTVCMYIYIYIHPGSRVSPRMLVSATTLQIHVQVRHHEVAQFGYLEKKPLKINALPQVEDREGSHYLLPVALSRRGVAA